MLVYANIYLGSNRVVDGKEIGSVESQLLCRSILDLYIGDDPFDSKAKEDIDLKLISAISK